MIGPETLHEDEQMTNAYGRLIQKVMKVNRKAAIKLARSIPSQICSSEKGLKVKGPNDNDDLSSAFTWAATKEGHRYWSSVYKQMGGWQE